jgi:hypothetical protein
LTSGSPDEYDDFNSKMNNMQITPLSRRFKFNNFRNEFDAAKTVSDCRKILAEEYKKHIRDGRKYLSNKNVKCDGFKAYNHYKKTVTLLMKLMRYNDENGLHQMVLNEIVSSILNARYVDYLTGDINEKERELNDIYQYNCEKYHREENPLASRLLDDFFKQWN